MPELWSPCPGGWTVQDKLRGSPQGSHSVVSPLQRGAVGSGHNEGFYLLSCEPWRGQQAPTKGSRLSDTDLGMFCVPLALVFGHLCKMADFLTGRDAHARAQARPTQTGCSNGLKT